MFWSPSLVDRVTSRGRVVGVLVDDGARPVCDFHTISAGWSAHISPGGRGCVPGGGGRALRPE